MTNLFIRAYETMSKLTLWYGIRLVLLAVALVAVYYGIIAYIHERGHAREIKKFAGQVGEKADISIELNRESGKGFLSMITKSTFLRWMVERKDQSEVQEMIKVVALAGIKNEKKADRAFLILALVLLVVAAQLGFEIVWAYVFTCTRIAYLVAWWFREDSSDMDYYKDPTTFTYKY